MKKVSIIIPVYNVEMYLEKCINSVIRQSYNNIEIILVNDGSVDSSKEICEYYKNKDGRVILLNQENQGVSKARNNALTICSGEFITFVDADDYLEENAISNYLNVQSEYNADLVIGNFNWMSKEIKIKNEKDNIDFILNRKDALKMLFSDNYFQGFVWNKLFKKQILRDYNIKFNEDISLGEDLLFVSNYIMHSETVIYNKEPIYNYFVNQQSALRKTFNKKYLTLIDALDDVSKIIESLDTDTKNLFYIFKVEKIIGIIDKMASSKKYDSRILKKLKLSINKSYDCIDNKCRISIYLKIKVVICKSIICLYWFALFIRNFGRKHIK